MQNEEPEFWEAAFNDKQEMWGLEPAASALITRDFFLRQCVRNVLIPGIGYGRNAKVFTDAGMAVTGIEISRTAITMAKKHYGDSLKIYHGSVTGMPFDEQLYDGIFCYALIHLLDKPEREKLISDCYHQLSADGCMVFTMISKEAPTYGKGTPAGRDRYAMFGGVELFFYDQASVEEEFGQWGLFEVLTVTENFPFFLVKCRKSQ
jgi:SAM-dependent methyltransferase